MANIHNYAQTTNYTAGSNALELTSLYLTSVNLPGINFAHPEIGGRSGARLSLSGDNIVYNALSFELLIDEDFNVYHEFMDKVFGSLNPEDGTFESKEFDFWVEINNSKGNRLFKIEFYNARVENISDIPLNSQDDITEFNMSVDVKYDYYKIIKDVVPPTISL